MRYSGDEEQPARVTPGVLIHVFLVAVLLNYPWELAQSPLYTQAGDWLTMLWRCGLASLGDGVLVLFIAALGALLLRRPAWFLAPGPIDYAVMLLIGFPLAIVVEWLAVAVFHLWAYQPTMPRLPLLGVGLTPVAQLLLLPPLSFALVARWRRQRRSPTPA